MKNNNPFTLMFGRTPQTIISRMEISDEIIEGFSAEPPVFQTYLISGVRGSGKTVLMTSVEKQFKESGGWIVVDLNSTQDLMTDLAQRLEDACKRIPNFLEKGIDLSAFGFGIGIGGTETARDNVSIIERLLEYVKRKNKKVLITIDEVANNKNMRTFASQFQIFARKEYPVFLVMTGLYENIYAIQNDPALTFLLRSPKVFLEPLNMRQIANQYQKLLDIDAEKAREFAKMTKGYAFAFQAFGMLYYKYGDSLKIDEIMEQLDNILDDYVYKKIWESLSAKEKQILLAMPAEEPIKRSDLCASANITQECLSKYRERLMMKGIITSPQYAYMTFALPRFGEIIREYV